MAAGECRKKLSTTYIMVAVIAQIVLGILASSLSLVADGTRAFSDHLELFRYDRSAVPSKRFIEIITVAVSSIIIFVISIIFLLTASSRASSLDFDINLLFLSIGTAISLATNTVQMIGHFHAWRSDPVYSLSIYVKTHRSRVLHGVLYHILAYSILVSSILIIISKNFLIADCVTTYLISSLIITNVAATSIKCYQEYFSLEIARDEYESL
ncbi:unnamed protein product [Caenorhabditis auriculariae]|uniref:Uncharacterized protein n=1 Tax=Caenorhabditis auriculariae TaxID=2777116 RepID=A0A8S1H086_9PELO|nr:unnamed protein product [Caenorhabditis auriculariae]